MRRLTAILLLAALPACADSATVQSPGATGGTSAPASPQPPSASAALPSASGTPTEYATSIFEPPFGLTLPPGWTVAERDAGAAQIYQFCLSCTHSGEENGEITLDMALADVPLEEAIAQLSEAANLEAGEVTPAEVGGLSGLMFTGARAGTADVAFQPSGYHSEPFGDSIDVYVVPLGGKTATIFVDPHEATGNAAEAFRETASEILDSLVADS